MEFRPGIFVQFVFGDFFIMKQKRSAYRAESLGFVAVETFCQ